MTQNLLRLKWLYACEVEGLQQETDHEQPATKAMMQGLKERVLLPTAIIS